MGALCTMVLLHLLVTQVLLHLSLRQDDPPALLLALLNEGGVVGRVLCISDRWAEGKVMCSWCCCTYNVTK